MEKFGDLPIWPCARFGESARPGNRSDFTRARPRLPIFFWIALPAVVEGPGGKSSSRGLTSGLGTRLFPLLLWRGKLVPQFYGETGKRNRFSKVLFSPFWIFFVNQLRIWLFRSAFSPCG